MLDADATIGRPLMYNHWSFGKHFAIHESQYRRGMNGLAYEIVINSSPCISYIMEENSMTMQTLVIAHAAFGHNHFFKNNHLFQQWTDAERSEEHTSELQSLMRISHAVYCLKKKNTHNNQHKTFIQTTPKEYQINSHL